MDCSGRFRHPLPADRFARDDLGASYESAVRQALERMRYPGRAEALEPFGSLFADTWRAEEIRAAGRPVVGVLCNFVPEHVIRAAGAIPLRLELGHGGAAEVGAKVLPVDTCPQVRAIVGAHLGALPLFELADLLVVPTACDGKKKLSQLLAELPSDRPREVWALELPSTKDYRRVGPLWRDQIQLLAKRVSKLTGRRIGRRSLRGATELRNRQSELTRELNALRRSAPGLLRGSDALLVFQASFIADPGWWNERVEALLDELGKRRSEAEPDVVRLMLSGSPVFFPDFRMLHLIEETGAVIVADEMCSGSQRLQHPTVIDERTASGMLRAAADHALLPSTCPCFVSSDDRIDQLLELIEQSGADGVVHHTLRLCQLFDIELVRVSGLLEERGVPLINIHAELGGEAPAAMKTRIEAFVEMLSA